MNMKMSKNKRRWHVGNFACHRCGKRGHFRSACTQQLLSPSAVAAAALLPAVATTSEEVHVAETTIEQVPALETTTDVAGLSFCKWCGETTHLSKLCRRFKTRLCDPECERVECPYAHSAAELRSTIWFHTEMCDAVVHTSECRRAFAHSEDERWNALSALTAVHMLADLLC